VSDSPETTPATAAAADDVAATDVVEPDPKRWFALGVIALAQLMVILDASIVNIALPHAQAALHISDANRQWVVTAYTLTFGGLLLLGGRIADYWGRKRSFMVGLAGFAIASALGGIAQTQAQLFGARALQGAFAALLAPAALSLITTTFTQSKERAQAFGVYGAIAGGGAAIGLILGGILTEYFSWRWTLLVNVPIAIVAGLLAIGAIKESKVTGNTKYDLPGAITATGGLVLLVYGLTKAGEIGWGNSQTIGWFVGAVVLLGLFILIELRSTNPLLPMNVILDRNRGGSYLANLFTAMGLFGMFLFLTYYFQLVLGYSPLKSGFAFLPFSIGIILSAGIAAQLLPRFGPRIPATIGLIAATAGMLWLSRLTPTSSYTTAVLPALIVMSFGLALVFVPLASTALFGVAPHDAGIASAVLNTTQQIGGSLGTALLNTIAATATAAYLVAHGSSSAKSAAVHGFTTAFWVSAGILAAATLIVVTFINADKDSLKAHDDVPVHVG
jgi:EmrB/QacA subfamily drug resistance transporter